MANYLIIGGSTGIGNALVNQLKEKHTVIATFNQTEIEIQNVRFIQFNVLEEEFPKEEIPEVLDGLIYCPGSINLKPFHRFSEEEFIQDFKLQVTSAIKIIQNCLTSLKKSQNASIVLFSTVAVQQGFSFHSQVASSKGALEGLTRSLAAELSPLIRVNAIAPSLTDTPLAEKLLSSDAKRIANAERNPLKVIGNPNDIAATAKFLLSSEAKWITGQILHVDGGMSSLKI